MAPAPLFMCTGNKGRMDFLDDESWRYFLSDMGGMANDHAIGEPDWNFSFDQQPDQSFMTGEQEAYGENYYSIFSEYDNMSTAEETSDVEVLKAAPLLGENACGTGSSLCDMHLRVQQLELELKIVTQTLEDHTTYLEELQQFLRQWTVIMSELEGKPGVLLKDCAETQENKASSCGGLSDIEEEGNL